MPAYNQRPYIEEALRSAIEQDYPTLQVVAGDDGSTDGTDEIIRDYARRYPDRVTPIVGEPHVGLGANCNRTLRACTGKYIAFFAGDDVLLPGKIRAQVDWLEQDEKRILCGHDVDVFDATTGASMFIARTEAEGEGADSIIRNGYLFTATAHMLRRTALPPGGYDERITIASDWQLFVECLVGGGRYGHVHGVFSRYRRKGSNMSERWECDPEFRRLWTEDNLLTLAWLELNHPRYSRSCRIRRGITLRDVGSVALSAGRIAEARIHFANALRNHLSLRTLLWALAAHMPAALRQPIAAALRGPSLM